MNNSRVPATAVVLLVVLMLSQAAWAQQIVIDANSVVVRTGSTTLLRYCHSDVPFKPYVKELFTPSGINVLLDAPPDHLHHHALMFACAVDGIDFWGEYAGQTGDRASDNLAAQPGKQEHLRFDDTATRGSPEHRRLRFAEQIRWVSQPQKTPVLLEHRTITAGRVGDPMATFLTWESVLTVPDGKESAVLTGSHYHGLGLRFIRSMDATGEFRNPDNDPGVIFRGEERLVRSPWCAYTAQADGKVVTVAMFGHPANPRHPTTWFTMAKPFAYLSATLRLHEEPLKVLPGKPLLLRYGVALWEGRVETDKIDAIYQHWVAMLPKDDAGQ